MSEMDLGDAIRANRERCARYEKARQLRTRIRLNHWEIMDRGRSAQADRIIERLNRRLAPLVAAFKQGELARELNAK